MLKQSEHSECASLKEKSTLKCEDTGDVFMRLFNLYFTAACFKTDVTLKYSTEAPLQVEHF